MILFTKSIPFRSSLVADFLAIEAFFVRDFMMIEKVYVMRASGKAAMKIRALTA